MTYDLAIIGAGIVGLATALALQAQSPQLQLVVLEKEQAIGAHQTGHNSGVIHAGIYYKPGSLKARLCVEGARRMVDFCDQNGIPYRRIGKLIVATGEHELPLLERLLQRAVQNGVPGIEQAGPDRMKELEPNAAGIRGLYSPNTAIVDYAQVVAAMRTRLERNGARILTGRRVTGIQSRDRNQQIQTPAGEIETRYLINCAGLYSDVIAGMSGLTPGIRIVPFRGEYYHLKPDRADLVRGLLYPVADPRLPFLGVHFTRRMNGEVEAGPNAVLAFAREGYRMAQVNPGELADTLRFGGFWRMGMKFWKVGFYEFYRSLSKPAFVRALQQLVPAVQEGDLVRGGAGVRAQAVNSRGDLVDDFAFAETASSLHVLNAVSPAATASLAIGQFIASRAAEIFQLDLAPETAPAVL